MSASKQAQVTRILPETADLRQAVQDTVNALKITPVHAGAAKLALEYADAIDTDVCPECGGHADKLEKLGPKLLAALEAVGATVSRTNTTKPAGQQSASQLERLRAAHRKT